MERLGAADPLRIGPYALAGRLGAGGMGEVYLGRSAGGRTVAVKVVRPDLARDTAFRDRFRREVAAARRVSGAFTAPVVDADTDAEVPWMATSFVAGLSLHSAVAAHGPLPEDALRMLTAGLAEALVSVHGAEVIHRDLKPANVLLALDGPHVIDFGIARATDGTALTSTGSVIGSAPYMSPEQALGQHLTAASDLFSLGSTVAFAASGASPFGDGAGAAVLFRVVHTEPDLSALPASLRHLIERCLAKDPGERPAPREVIAYVEQGERPRPSAGWLPEPVAADVLALRAVLTALPGPDPSNAPTAALAPPAPTLPLTGPTQVLPGGSATAPDQARPGRGPTRRKLLLGLAGGTLAVVGGGTVWALNRDTSKGAGGTPRPSGNDVPEAKLAWQVRQPAGSTQVLSANGIVACVSLRQVWGVDDQGHTKWTVNSDDHGLAFSVTGPNPRNVAAVDGGRLHVGGTTGVQMSDPKAPPRTAVLGMGMADGKDPWKATLNEAGGMGVSGFCGIRDGRAHLISLTYQEGTASGGFGVWALDLASRGTAWYHTAETLPVFWALPHTGGGALYAGTDKLIALDAKGAVAWSKGFKPFTVAAAGRYFVLVDGEGTMSALEPATGRQAWQAAGAVGASARGDGIATDEQGSVLYALWRDKDGGFSLAALDSATGKTKWKTPVPADAKGSAQLGARLLYADGNVYRMGADCVLWAFDASNGKFRWKFTGWKGTNPVNLAWSAGDGRLALSNPSTTTVAALHANGA
ncbi:PQQ-binding-like beta-propeller repeat protein [Streptomyces sp. NPDC059989]|uniref:protein kinase domain-containing protein n=1 Tax=Streptomyces sp. NPDC059989 TaxID=3347026 RepID=UPI0036C5CCDF